MKQVRFQMGVSGVILGVVAVATAVMIAIVWLTSSRTVETSVIQVFAEKAARTDDHLSRLLGEALRVTDLGAALPGVATRPSGDGSGHAALAVMHRTLDANPAFYSAYVGYDDGSFLQMIAVRDQGDVRAAIDAPDGTGMALRAIVVEGGHRVQRWTFLDDGGQPLARREEPEPDYDPRQRGWYGAAGIANGAVLSQPYVFNSLKQPGITASRRIDGGGGVMGIDITLGSLDTFVAGLAVSAHGAVFLLDEANRLLAAPPAVKGRLAPLATATAADHPYFAVAAAAGEGVGPVVVDGQRYVAHLSQQGAGRIRVALVAPFEDFTDPIRRTTWWIVLAAAALLAGVLPVTALAVRRMSRSLQLLTEDAERITELDFSGKPPKDSPVAEFATLSRAFAMMKDTVLTRTRELESAQAKLGHLVEIGIAMAGESHIGQMIELILREAETISGADGGTLFLMTGDRKALTFEFIHNTSLDLAIGGTQAAEFELPTMPYLDPATGEPRLDDVVCAAIHRARAIAVADVYADPRFDFTRLHEFDRRTGYRSRSLLVVPLNPRGGKVIGAIQLINAHRGKAAEPVAFSDGVRRHVEALAAQAANALYNRSLLDAQEALVDGMVKVIAGAIDTKSPYTGAHCLRVPELAVMLAEEASKVETGPLAGFAFTTEAEWREFRIGAWLHDCGKVTTPEYLVDKATKLETIHNRIHEVRTRFEVLLRDATIARLEAVAAGADPVAVEAAFERRRRQLADDFAFVAECNVGGEVMAADKVERLKRIGATPWQRHFDDRLGLSHEELRRLEAVPEQPLPADETLLADRPEQVMPWSGGEQHFDPAFGFTLTVPPVMFDRGEIHSLSVPRGTLTEEERFKITEHAVQTVVMLEGLPFPDHLRRVPEYAGTHHETLDGKGYPRSLSARDLSVPARIMAIADIFEALTASDRPYKKAKTLSEAVAILDGLRRRGHVDSDLFELFLTSGAYRRYGERFLSPEQLDSIDVPAYLS